MALTALQQIRYELGDVDPAFPLMTDTEYEYFLEKNDQNVRRATMDSARVILMKLSLRTDQTIDIFSIKGSKAAEQYRMALELFLRSPDLNPVLNNVKGWVGGVSKSEMQANDENPDNNVIPTVFQSSTPNGDPFNY